MSAATAPQPALRRSTGDVWLAGVCAGIGAAPRRRRRSGSALAFVVATIAGGFGIPVYALAWVAAARRRRRRAAAAAAHRPRRGRGRARRRACSSSPRCSPCARPASRGSPTRSRGRSSLRRRRRRAHLAHVAERAARRRPPTAAARRPRGDAERRRRASARAGPPTVVSRTGARHRARRRRRRSSFLQATGALGAARDVALAALVVAVALAVIFAPWIIRLARSLDRRSAPSASARRSAPRSPRTCTTRVLQTLALVQKRADDPRAVAAARPPAGARAARVAVRPHDAARRATLRAALEAGRRARSRSSTARPSTSSRSATAPLDERSERARRRRARGDGQRGAPRRRRGVGLRRGDATSARRSSSATAAPGFDPARRARRPQGHPASRSSGVWSATAAARRSTPRPGRAPRWS